MILLPILGGAALLGGLVFWKKKHDAALAASPTTGPGTGPAPGSGTGPAPRPGSGYPLGPAPGGGEHLPPSCNETAVMIATDRPKEAAILLSRCRPGLAPAGQSSCDQAALMLAIGQTKEAAVLFDRCRRGIPAVAQAPSDLHSILRAHHTGGIDLVQNAAAFVANAHHAYGQRALDGATNTMVNYAYGALLAAARHLALNPNAAGSAEAAKNAADAMLQTVNAFYVGWNRYNYASYGNTSSMVPVSTWETWTGGLAAALRHADYAVYQLQIGARAPQPASAVAHAPLGAMGPGPRQVAPLGHLGLRPAAPAGFMAPR